MKTILVIDDDPDDLGVFCDAVRDVDASIKCIECADPLIAKRLIESMVLPSIMFIDINMPLYTGFELLNDIRNEPRLNDTPVAMLSTSMPWETKAKLKEMGAQYTLVKPSTYGEFIAMLRPILAKI